MSEEAVDRLRVAPEAFPKPLRPGLLRILTLSDKERAQAIGEMFQEGVTPNLAECCSSTWRRTRRLGP